MFTNTAGQWCFTKGYQRDDRSKKNNVNKSDSSRVWNPVFMLYTVHIKICDSSDFLSFRQTLGFSLRKKGLFSHQKILPLCSFNNCMPSCPPDVYRAGGPLKGESQLNLHGQNRPYFYCEGHACGLEHNAKTKTDCAECVLEAGVKSLYLDGMFSFSNTND